VRRGKLLLIMDDWGSPWADDTGTSQLSPPAAVPVASEPSSPNPNDSQSVGNVLTSLERSSPWADDEGLREWASAESVAAPAIDAFPDWGAEASTEIHLPLDGKEKGSVVVQSEVKPFWANEAGLPLNTVVIDPEWKPRISHPTLATESVSSIDKVSVEAELGPQADGEIKVFSRSEEKADTPQGPLAPTTLLADWKSDRSTGVVDIHTGPPLNGGIEAGISLSRPSSPLASEESMKIGTAESPRSSFEGVVLSHEQKLLSSPPGPLPALTDPISLRGQSAAGDGEDDFGEFEEANYAEVGESEVAPLARSPVALERSGGGQATLAASTPRIDPDVLTFEVDMSLLGLLIPQSSSLDPPPDIEDDIISSTSR
jgi:hypothetical protein